MSKEGNPFKHASLFSGIGGFDLAAQWMGWTNVFTCELDPFCQRVLRHYWPDAIHYEDIKKTCFKKHRHTIDVLSGGFPCQPYSVAGKRLGKADPRDLWPEMLRAICEVQPALVLGENTDGLTSWDDGLVFSQIISEMEAQGYEVQPVVLPVAGISAPHARHRVFFVAKSKNRYVPYGLGGIQEQSEPLHPGKSEPPAPSHQQEPRQPRPDQPEITLFGDTWKDVPASNPNSPGIRNCKSGALGSSQGKGKVNEEEWQRVWSHFNRDGATRIVADTASKRRLPYNRHRKPGQPDEARATYRWEDFPTESPLFRGDDGVSSKLAGISIPSHRRQSVKGFGNSVSPQLVYVLYCAMIDSIAGANPG